MLDCTHYVPHNYLSSMHITWNCYHQLISSIQRLFDLTTGVPVPIHHLTELLFLYCPFCYVRVNKHLWTIYCYRFHQGPSESEFIWGSGRQNEWEGGPSFVSSPFRTGIRWQPGSKVSLKCIFCSTYYSIWHKSILFDSDIQTCKQYSRHFDFFT